MRIGLDNGPCSKTYIIEIETDAFKCILKNCFHGKIHMSEV